MVWKDRAGYERTVNFLLRLIKEVLEGRVGKMRKFEIQARELDLNYREYMIIKKIYQADIDKLIGVGYLLIKSKYLVRKYEGSPNKLELDFLQFSPIYEAKKLLEYWDIL